MPAAVKRSPKPDQTGASVKRARKPVLSPAGLDKPVRAATLDEGVRRKGADGKFWVVHVTPKGGHRWRPIVKDAPQKVGNKQPAKATTPASKQGAGAQKKVQKPKSTKKAVTGGSGAGLKIKLVKKTDMGGSGAASKPKAAKKPVKSGSGTAPKPKVVKPQGGKSGTPTQSASGTKPTAKRGSNKLIGRMDEHGKFVFEFKGVSISTTPGVLRIESTDELRVGLERLEAFLAGECPVVDITLGPWSVGASFMVNRHSDVFKLYGGHDDEVVGTAVIAAFPYARNAKVINAYLGHVASAVRTRLGIK